jgi:uncharacterized protein (TIGR02594 family)
MQNLKPLAWIEEARKHIGKREIGASNMSPFIKDMQKTLGWEWLGNVPWCGIFVSYVLHRTNLYYPKDGYRAASFKTLTTSLDKPAVGAIAVYQREGGGHVGFVVGQTQDGRVMVLGANQGNAINIMPFSRGRVVDYRWPSVAPHPSRYDLPIIYSDMDNSGNEQ